MSYSRVTLEKRAVRKLEAKSKDGPDGLPPIFIKTCYDVYSQCVELFSYVPPDWLRAYITQVFQKGDTSCPLDYMEVIIKDQLSNSVLHNSLISKHQHGFLSKLSAGIHPMIGLLHYIAVAMLMLFILTSVERSKTLFLIKIKLLAKLEHYGITSKLLNCISAFIQTIIHTHNKMFVSTYAIV